MNVEKTVDIEEQIKKDLDALLRKEILIGIPESESARNNDTSITNSAIGYINEFGSPQMNIPARPHLIPGVRAASDKTSKLMAQALKFAMEGKDGIGKLKEAGGIAVSSVKNVITLGEGFAPISDFTRHMREKNNISSDKPLIATAEYRDTITYVIVEE